MTRVNIRDYLHFQDEDESGNEFRLTQDQKDEMLEAFTLYDKDRDGLISTRELGTVIRALGHTLTLCEETDIVALFEHEKCYAIDFITFYKLMRGRRKKFDEDNELKESFRRFDKEDSGFVNKNELKTMLLTAGEPLTNDEVEDWLKDGKEFTKGGKLYYENFVKMSMERSMTTSNDNPSNDNTDYTQASNLSLYSMEILNTENYEPTEEEKEGLCKAFSLLDTDGDGVIALEDLEQQLISWGRLPLNEEHEDLMSYAKGTGCGKNEGDRGMDFEGFQKYITKQLANTTDEETLRNAFQVFDSNPPTGKIDVAELRHYLKHTGLKLTDDEINFLFREEDYWMLEENKVFEYEQLISKILNKPTCKSPFLNC